MSVALAAIGIGSSLIQTGMSVGQAITANRDQRKAEREAKAAMERAKNLLSANHMAGLSIAKEPYELQREAVAQAAAQALEYGQTNRGAAAVAGNVMMGTTAQNRQIRADMSQELQGLRLLEAQEEARLQKARTELELGEVEGAQQAASDNWALKQYGIQGAISGVAGIAEAAQPLVPLYQQKQRDNRPEPLLNMQPMKAQPIATGVTTDIQQLPSLAAQSQSPLNYLAQPSPIAPKNTTGIDFTVFNELMIKGDTRGAMDYVNQFNK